MGCPTGTSPPLSLSLLLSGEFCLGGQQGWPGGGCRLPRGKRGSTATGQPGVGGRGLHRRRGRGGGRGKRRRCRYAARKEPLQILNGVLFLTFPTFLSLLPSFCHLSFLVRFLGAFLAPVLLFSLHLSFQLRLQLVQGLLDAPGTRRRLWGEDSGIGRSQGRPRCRGRGYVPWGADFGVGRG